MAKPVSIEVWNPNGKYRVVSTKSMPGTRWINLLVEQDCRVEVIFIFLFFSALSLFLFKFNSFLWNYMGKVYGNFFDVHSDMYTKENYIVC
jgi:hypothetical protein